MINTGKETISRDEARIRLERDLAAIKNNPSLGAQQTATQFIERTAARSADEWGKAARQQLNLMQRLWRDVRPDLRMAWFENARSVLGILKERGLAAFTLTWTGNPEDVPQYAEEPPSREDARAGKRPAPPPEVPRTQTPPERGQTRRPKVKKNTPPPKEKETKPTGPPSRPDRGQAERLERARESLKIYLTNLVEIIQGQKKNVTEEQLNDLVDAINEATTLVPFDVTTLLGQLAALATTDGLVLHDVPTASGRKLTLRYAAREKKWIVGSVPEAKNDSERMSRIADELKYCLNKKSPVISDKLVERFNRVSATMSASNPADYSRIVLGPLVERFGGAEKMEAYIRGGLYKVKFKENGQQAFSVVHERGVWTLRQPRPPGR